MNCIDFPRRNRIFFSPLLESGEITLLATTTENPSFSVTRQLLSRLHVLKLRPLSPDELLQLAQRGADLLEAKFDRDCSEFLTATAHGDARTLLNLIEYAAELPEEKRALKELMHSLPEIVLRHDREGDSHYELASALIKIHPRQ